MAFLNLPEEMEMDVLSRLPVESLVRFKCVSNPFRSLISDPYFVKFHLNRSILSKNGQKILCSRFPRQSIDFESLLDDDDDNNKKPQINDDSNAICYVVDELNVILYNPSSRVSKKLPEIPNTPLFFDKSRRIECYYGFGFDSDNDDYKNVCMYGLISFCANGTFDGYGWLMKENGVKASWTRFLTLPSNIGYGAIPLCYLRNGEILLKIESVPGVIDRT
ncbi:F-box/kelch-repeat protein At3g06240-like [Cornus florida]|uniref:F-box/kelch-repeat protein At3g06240-like n=1 Tax=Cornus florida TaxID=4283 RepID=UPI00289730E5|nr:F-box/kelch-repeat protein At3g06240-like [Cornus florida]